VLQFQVQLYSKDIKQCDIGLSGRHKQLVEYEDGQTMHAHDQYHPSKIKIKITKSKIHLVQYRELSI